MMPIAEWLTKLTSYTLQSTSNYVNEVIVQQHAVILTDSDRTIRVLCSFEVSDQTITLGSVEQKQIPLLPNGIDVSYVMHLLLDAFPYGQLSYQ